MYRPYPSRCTPLKFFNPIRLVVLRAELAYRNSCLPHLALAQGFQFGIQLLAVVGPGVAVNLFIQHIIVHQYC